MCYAIPGKVVSIEGKSVFVDYFGEKRKAYNELGDLRIGDYIFAQGGFVIEKLSTEAAESILSVWKETFFELQAVDLKLSHLDLSDKGVGKRFLQVLDRAVEGRELSQEELHVLLDTKEKSALDLLCKTGNFLRQKYHGNSCCVHGIIEISNYCSAGCSYCGISGKNKLLSRYRMTKQEILSAAHEAIHTYGFKALVLQSGEDSGYSIEELADIIKEIKQRDASLIFISFGEVGLKNLEILYEAGARGLLMRFETSRAALYAQVNQGKDLATRIAHLKRAYEIGYMIITGGLIGLPGQTNDDLIDDIKLAKELHAEMFSFGPFIPHPQSDLASGVSPTPEEILKVLAVARIMDKENAKILVTTALETISPHARKEALLAGANSVMLNVTPLLYRKLYSIYPHRAHESERIDVQINEVIALLRSLGRSPTDLSISY